MINLTPLEERIVEHIEGSGLATVRYVTYDDPLAMFLVSPNYERFYFKRKNKDSDTYKELEDERLLPDSNRKDHIKRFLQAFLAYHQDGQLNGYASHFEEVFRIRGFPGFSPRTWKEVCAVYFGKEPELKSSIPSVIGINSIYAGKYFSSDFLLDLEKRSELETGTFEKITGISPNNDLILLNAYLLSKESRLITLIHELFHASDGKYDGTNDKKSLEESKEESCAIEVLTDLRTYLISISCFPDIFDAYYKRSVKPKNKYPYEYLELNPVKRRFLEDLNKSFGPSEHNMEEILSFLRDQIKKADVYYSELLLNANGMRKLRNRIKRRQAIINRLNELIAIESLSKTFKDPFILPEDLMTK